MLTLEVPLEATALDAAQERMAAWLEGQGVPGPARYRLRLVVDELLANLMMHGRFRGPPPPARLRLSVEPGAAILVLEDAAEPFDPRSAPEPAGPPSLGDNKLGGLGLSLVRRMAEIRAYERLPEGWNRTELAITSANEA